MAGKMWISTPAIGVWIPCAQAPLAWTDEGRTVRTELLNGGAYVKSSLSRHRVSTPTWKGTLAELQVIKDVFAGVYGDPPFYYVEPAATKNALPPHWATPSLATGDDYPRLLIGSKPTRVASVLGPDFPPFAASFSIPVTPPTLTAMTPRATIPLPPGYIGTLCAWGSVVGTGRVAVTAYNRTTGVASTNMVVPSSSGSLLTYYGDTYSHMDIWLTKADSTTSLVNLNAMVATVSVDSSLPTKWYGGQGVSAMKLDGALSSEAYQTLGEGRGTLSATLVEVGSWLRP